MTTAAVESIEERLKLVMRTYNQQLFRIARAILRDDDEAEEVVQSAYLTAFTKIDQFSGGPYLSAWLRKITVHRAYDRLRTLEREKKANLTNRELDEERITGSTTQATPEEMTARNEARRYIELAIDSLPDALRSVFVMREVQEMTSAETAECLGIEEGAVRVRLHRARGLMRARLRVQMENLYKQSFHFAGSRCDRIVEKTLLALRNMSAEGR